MAEGNGAGRLDRIEAALALLIDDHVQFREEHKRLLTAQVVLTDRMDQLVQAQSRTDKKLAELAEAQTRTDGQLSALIAVVDGIVRRGSS